jgi:O-antigen ligase
LLLALRQDFGHNVPTMWPVIFFLGMIVVLVKTLREAIYAAMAAAYVYYCLPVREFFVPDAPYQAAFWALAALFSLRYGSMMGKWSTSELVDASKNALVNGIASVRDGLQQLIFNAAASRSEDSDLQRRFEAQVERPLCEFVQKSAPAVLRDNVLRAAKTTIQRALKVGTGEAQKLVESMPDASEPQLRSSMKQRVAPTIDQVLDDQADEILQAELGDVDKLATEGESQQIGSDQMGSMPKPRSPILAVLTNSGLWMFVGFTLITVVGAQLAVHRPGMAQVKVATCRLMFIPLIGIICAVRTDRHFKLFTWAWMFGVWQLSATAGKQWITYGGRIDDVGGQGGEANFLGAIIVMVAPVAFSMLMSEKTAGLRRMGYLAAAGYILGILACGSRGAMCAFIGQMGYWLMHTTKKAKAYALGLVAVAIFIAVAPPEFIDRMATIIEPKGAGFSKPKVEESKHERQLLWALAVEVFKENPVIGVGAQQYTHYSAVRLPNLTGAYSGKPGLMTHNSWLQILAEYGVVGSFFYIGGYLWSIFCFRRARKKLLPFENFAWFRAYCLGFEAGGLGAALAMVFSSFQWLDFIFWYLIFGPLAYMIALETRARLEWLTPIRPQGAQAPKASI